MQKSPSSCDRPVLQAAVVKWNRLLVWGLFSVPGSLEHTAGEGIPPFVTPLTLRSPYANLCQEQHSERWPNVDAL